jgi:hypothetical protein
MSDSVSMLRLMVVFALCACALETSSAQRTPAHTTRRWRRPASCGSGISRMTRLRRREDASAEQRARLATLALSPRKQWHVSVMCKAPSRVAADGAPRSPGGASHVTGVFGAEDEWGCSRTGPAFRALHMTDACHQ